MKKTHNSVDSKIYYNGYNGFLEALKKDEYPCPDCGKMKDTIFDCYNCFVPGKEWFKQDFYDQESLKTLKFSVTILECWNDLSWLQKLKWGAFRKYADSSWETYRKMKNK